MKPVSWELEMKFKDTDQYLEFMKGFLAIEEDRQSLITEFHIESDDTGASHEGVIMTIYCVWGERLKEYAELLSEMEGAIE